MANWYYYENDVKKGPINTAQLKALAANGTINPTTLIETEEGKQGRAGKINGLTFSEQKQNSEVTYYFTDETGVKKGFTKKQLQALIDNGNFTAETPLETDGGRKGTAGQIPGLKFKVVPVSQPSVSSNHSSNTTIPTVKNETGKKNRVVASILAVLFGVFGAHKFYLGQTGLGCIYFFFIFGFPITVFIVIMEGIILLFMSDEEFDKRYNHKLLPREGIIYVLDLLEMRLDVYEDRVEFVRKTDFTSSPRGVLHYVNLADLQLTVPGSLIKGELNFYGRGVDFSKITKYTVLFSSKPSEYESVMTIYNYIQKKKIPEDVVFVLNGFNSTTKVWVYEDRVEFPKTTNMPTLPNVLYYAHFAGLRLGHPSLLGNGTIDIFCQGSDAKYTIVFPSTPTEYVSAITVCRYIQEKIIPKDVVFVLNGMNTMLWVYENKIVFIRGGFWSFMAHGLSGQKTLYYHNITSMQLRLATQIAGFLQFSIPGGHESNAGVLDASTDENSITFPPIENDIAQKIHAYIEKKLLESHNSKQNVAIQHTSSIGELKQMKDLLDAGVVSQEEFDAFKKKILG